MAIPSSAELDKRFKDYSDVYGTLEARRDLARLVVDPHAKLPTWGGYTWVRLALSSLYTSSEKIQRNAGNHLWTTLPLAETMPGQIAIIFHAGDEDTPSKLHNGAYLSFSVGTIPGDLDEVGYTHSYKGAGPLRPVSAFGIRPPFIDASVSLPLIDGRRVSIDVDRFEIEAVTPGRDIYPIFQASSHIGGDLSYSIETSVVRVNPVLLGTPAVQAFLEGQLKPNLSSSNAEKIDMLTQTVIGRTALEFSA